MIITPGLLNADERTRALNGKALAILTLILARCQPSIRELMVLTKIRFPNEVMFHLRRLRRMGLIEWEDNKARTLHACVRFIPADRLAEEAAS